MISVDLYFTLIT